MKKIKFLTLHPLGTNVDLIKDEGQIPYTLTKNHGFNTKIVSSYIRDDKENCSLVPGLQISHFPFVLNESITGLLYLLFHSKEIEWLNIYFAGRKAYIWSKLFKSLNPKGKIYLKLDMDFRSCDLYDFDLKEREIFSKNTEIVDIVSVESETVRERIQKYSEKDILLIRDGLAQIDSPIKLNKKENCIITVARLGTMQKATDFLLEAFATSADKHDWKLKLIGSVENDFEVSIKQFFATHPHLKDRVIFTGPIQNREALYEEYCKAKIFVLPSRWESFGISSVEALSRGCYLILSDCIPPAIEMTNNGKYGKIIKSGDVQELADAIVSSTKRNFSVLEAFEMSNYALNKFSWDNICLDLVNEMSKIDNLES